MPKRWVTRATGLCEMSQMEIAVSEGTLSALRRVLRYACDPDKLGPELAPAFVELCASERTLDFVRTHPAHSLPAAWARTATGWFLSNADANAFLSMYSMHVLDRDSAALLLDLPSSHSPDAAGAHSPQTHGEMPAARPLRLLDVGAGDGAVTAELAPLFSEVLATEVSAPCVRAIRRRGIPCERIADLSALGNEHWDVVACLNVLDRCSRPLDLLADIHRLTEPRAGQVLLAVVLPFRPFVECGAFGRLQAPDQSLHLDPNASCEAAVQQLAARVLKPAGFKILKVSRVPYLCQGDTGSALYALDDAIFVLICVASRSFNTCHTGGRLLFVPSGGSVFS